MGAAGLDSHVCGFCARQFFSIDDFLAHKKVCELICPSSGLLSPPSSNETVGVGGGHRCPLCPGPEVWRTAAGLDWHLTEHHEDARPLQCAMEGCHARQPTRRDMAAHLRLHRTPAALLLPRPRSASPPTALTHPLQGRASLPPFNAPLHADILAPHLDSQRRPSPSPSYSDLSRPTSPQLQSSSPQARSNPALERAFPFFDRPLDLSNAGVPPGPLHPWRQEPPTSDLYPGAGLFFGAQAPPIPPSFSQSWLPPISPSLLSGTKDLSSDDDWESMMEVNQVDENEKIRQLVGDKPQPPVTDPNQCLICRRILSCKSALQMHYRTHTGERPFKCKICLRAFTTKGNLKTHMGVHRSKHPFRMQHQCPICQKRFLNSALLHQHMRLHTSHLTQPRPPPTTFAPSPMTPPAQEFPPTSIAPAPPPPSSANPFMLSLHNLAQQQQQRQLSPEVKRESSEPAEKIRKRESTEGVGPEEVLGFNPSTLLPPNPFGPGATNPFGLLLPQPPPNLTPPSSAARPSTTCNICFKTFACYSALEIHYRSHTGDKPFICPTCGRGFSTRGNMKQHLMTHKIRDAAAAAALHSKSSSPAVSEASVGPASLEPHTPASKEASASPAPSYNSSSAIITTPTSLPSQSSAEREVKRETEESTVVTSAAAPPPPSTSTDFITPFTSGSGSSLATSSSIDGSGPSPLEAIKMMWAQTEPAAPRKTPVLSRHQCGVCFKHFSSSSALQIHMRTHTGDKPFKCTICGRAFTTKGNLKVHMGTHMWNNPSRRGRRIFDFPLGLDGTGVGSGAGSANGSEGLSVPASESGGEDSKEATTPLVSAASLMPPFFPLRPLLPPPVSAPALPPLFQSPPLPLPPHSAAAVTAAVSTASVDGKNPMEAMLWMWRNVCSVCQKVCSSSGELEEHLKLHLQAGPRLAAAQGLLQHQ